MLEWFSGDELTVGKIVPEWPNVVGDLVDLFADSEPANSEFLIAGIETEAGERRGKEPRVRAFAETHVIEIDGDNAIVDGDEIPVTSKQALLLRLLLDNVGEYVSLADHRFRSRDVDGLPERLRAFVETQPGAGTRIIRQNLNRQ